MKLAGLPLIYLGPSAFFMTDYYPSHKKALALIVIAECTSLFCFPRASVCFCATLFTAELFPVFLLALTGFQVCTSHTRSW